jgi:hypothetical protein
MLIFNILISTYLMDKICDQILDKLICTINRPNLKKKINQEIVEPIIQNIYKEMQGYIVIIMCLYGLILLLLLLILFILFCIKNKKVTNDNC